MLTISKKKKKEKKKAGLSVMANWGSEFRFFQDIHIKNGWHLNFHGTWDQQNWTAGKSRGVGSLKTNQAATGDIITLIMEFNLCRISFY